MIGTWNIRGLNTPLKQKEVLNLIHKYNLSVLGILETKVKKDNISSVKENLRRDWESFINNEMHQMGMIWIHWDPKRVALKVLYSYAQMVHCHVQWHEQKLEFFTSFVYGFNELEERKSLWKDIKTYASSNEAWCVIGDFNAVLTSEDRKGGNPVSNGETADFRDCLEKCGLEEMPFSGPYFTWNNKQKGGDRIYSKLDRMVANIEWVLKMGTKTVIIHEGISDHCPLI
ncbi:hypothetical protein DM860_007266 [Cuscuta australis]|uniref:Endonuclease/exonuclease/phosphatase domain-containing protein n=1 Tax=Cuscuta australis TaxID=267555 RepID=A0A328E710_9ASTE|nr:hypothetical protein DM860_007266 [Cuscuta australis]